MPIQMMKERIWQREDRLQSGLHSFRSPRLIALSVVLLISFFDTAASALAAPPLFLNPTTAEVSLAPGGFQNQVVRIINQTTAPLALTVTVTGATPDQGLGGLQLAAENRTNTIQADQCETLPYITVSNPKISIDAGQKGEINYTIMVPTATQPGSYYGAMTFGVGDPAFINLTVYSPNQTTATVTPKLTNFAPNRVGLVPTVNISVTISNPTTTAIRPSGNVTFYNSKNQQIGIVPISSGGTLLYPGNTGSYATKWRGSGLMFGRYTAKLTIFSVNGFPAMSSEKVMWILPWWWLGLIALVLYAIIRVRRGIYQGTKYLFGKALRLMRPMRDKSKAHTSQVKKR
jgi:hypothetical protein